MSKGISTARIQLHFDVHEPIELVDLTLSFQAVAREYRSFLSNRAKEEGGKAGDADVKLYVTSIKNNCILAELGGATEIMGALFATMNYTVVFTDFIKHIQSAVSYLRVIGQTGKPDIENLPYNKRQVEIFSDMLKTASKNKDGTLGFSVLEYEAEDQEAKERLTIRFSSDEALEARRGALLTSQALNSKKEADYQSVIMYFHQANIDEPKSEGKTGFRGVIKAISDKDFPVHFISDLDRDRISDLVASKGQNPFKASYRVDVNVETNRHDKPVFYRVIALHEIIPDED